MIVIYIMSVVMSPCYS